MIYTSTIYDEIVGSIDLSPSAEAELRQILRSHDGERIIDDLPDEQ